MHESKPDKVSLAAFIGRHTHDLSLRDGTRVRLRPVTPDDKQNIRDGLKQLSEESRYRRFMTPIETLSDKQLRHLTEIDYHDHFAWGAFAVNEPGEPGIGVARYVRDAERPEVAEPAVAIVDAYQGRGLGLLLLSILTNTAVEHGVRLFRASLLHDNDAMREVFRHAGAHFLHEGGGVMTAEVALPSGEYARAQLLYGMIRNACEGAIARARKVFLEPGDR